MKEYVTSVMAPLTLAFLTTFAAATYVFTYVIPFDLIVDSFQSFDTDVDQWRSNLSEVRKDHAAFASLSGLNEAQVDQLQKSLWNDWPAIAACTAILLLIAYYVVFKTAGRAVCTWASGIRKRRSAYARGDVTRMQNGEFVENQVTPIS